MKNKIVFILQTILFPIGLVSIGLVSAFAAGPIIIGSPNIEAMVTVLLVGLFFLCVIVPVILKEVFGIPFKHSYTAYLLGTILAVALFYLYLVIFQPNQ